MKMYRFNEFNLNEKHAPSVIHTDNFKSWFGDWEKYPRTSSKVVNKDGSPKVVYHGSKSDHTVFNKEKIGSGSGNYGHYGYGFYFSFEKIEAEYYGPVKEFYINIKNPFKATPEQLYQLMESGYNTGLQYEILSTDHQSVYNAVQEKYPVCAKLYAAMIMYGFEDGWENFLEKNNIEDAEIDPNDMTDLFDLAAEGDASIYMKKLGLQTDNLKYIKGFRHIPDLAYITDLGNYSLVKEFTEHLIGLGFDGVIYGSEIVAFEPNQIRLATTDINENSIWDKYNADDTLIEFNIPVEQWTAQVLDKMGITPKDVKPIAYGGYGMAIDLGDGTVFKITTQESEAYYAHKLINISSRNLVKVYDVKIVESDHQYGELYVIHMEKLNTNINNGVKHIIDYLHKSNPIINKVRSGIEVSNEDLSDFFSDKIRSLSLDSMRFYYNMWKRVYDECMKYDIPFDDLHSGNMGLRQNLSEFVFFDITSIDEIRDNKLVGVETIYLK